MLPSNLKKKEKEVKSTNKDNQDVDLILVLGGDPKREGYAIRSSLNLFPDRPVWISGADLSKVDIFEFLAENEIDPDLIRLDYRAIDTLSNITTMINDIKKENFKCVAIVTSKYHSKRVRGIVSIIFRKYGISYKLINIRYKEDPKAESIFKVWRDKIRARLWYYFNVDLYPLFVKIFQVERQKEILKKIKQYSFTGKRARLN